MLELQSCFPLFVKQLVQDYHQLSKRGIYVFEQSFEQL